jgi:hypothetical protein
MRRLAWGCVLGAWVNLRVRPAVPGPSRKSPELDIVRVYRSDGQRFGKPIELSAQAGDVLTTPLLPDLELPLARLFAER